MLPEGVRRRAFAFYGTALIGHAAAARRAGSARIDATNDALGEPSAKLYVQRYFPPARKAQVKAMVKNIMAAFDRRIDALDWMAPADEGEGARRSSPTLEVGVGYPGHLARLLGATRSSAATRSATPSAPSMFEYQRNLAKLGKPVDRDEWCDDAADGQRGEPAGAERAELPGRHPAAAVLRSDAAARDTTTARSAR